LSRSFFLAILLLSAQRTLVAQSASPCDSASTTASIHQCWDQVARSADSTLQRYLAEARRVTSHKQLVDSTQRVWIRYRDLQCRAAGAELQGGTLEPVTVVICFYDLTHARTHDVWAAYLSNGDSSLPEPGKNN